MDGEMFAIVFRINIVQIKFGVLNSANKTKISCMSSITAGVV
jgi:hypothetical protein